MCTNLETNYYTSGGVFVGCVKGIIGYNTGDIVNVNTQTYKVINFEDNILTRNYDGLEETYKIRRTVYLG